LEASLGQLVWVLLEEIGFVLEISILVLAGHADVAHLVFSWELVPIWLLVFDVLVLEVLLFVDRANL
jgi:hypothetical protein